MDEPFARQSAYVRWEIANLTKQHRRKVLLNGEGADEVLGGYVSFAPRFMVDLLKRGHPLRFGRELCATLSHPERKRILRELRAAVSPATSHQAAARARTLQRKYEISVEPVAEERREYDGIKGFLHDQVEGYSLPRLLVCNDKMSMANSVEGRAPFLDHEFVDLVFSMDTTKLMLDGWRKFPLREAMRGLVPDEILFRKSKDAFNAPIFEYLRSDAIRRRVLTSPNTRGSCPAAAPTAPFCSTGSSSRNGRGCSRSNLPESAYGRPVRRRAWLDGRGR
jgi:asparagine synthase (glutamine-hydrolysing)